MSETTEALDALRRQLAMVNQSYPGDLVEIGDFTYGNPRILSWGEGSKLKIGKFCSIAQGVTIFLGGEHRSDWVTTYPFNALMKEFSYLKGHPKSKGDVVIGNDVWLAAGSTILSGVHIGSGAVVGANATVGKDVPPYAIVAGNPAKLIRYRFSPEVIEKLLETAWWNWDDESICNGVAMLQNGEIEAFFQYYSKEVAPKR